MLLLTITKMLTSFAILSTMVPLQLVLAKDKKTPDSNSNNTMSFKTNNTNSFDGNHTNETIITSTKINKKSTNSSNDASSGDVGSSETLPVALPLVGCKWFNSLNLKVAIYEILKIGYNFRWGSTRTTLKPIQASLTLSSASRVKVKISRRDGSADFPALFFIFVTVT